MVTHHNWGGTAAPPPNKKKKQKNGDLWKSEVLGCVDALAFDHLLLHEALVLGEGHVPGLVDLLCDGFEPFPRTSAGLSWLRTTRHPDFFCGGGFFFGCPESPAQKHGARKKKKGGACFPVAAPRQKDVISGAPTNKPRHLEGISLPNPEAVAKGTLVEAFSPTSAAFGECRW